MEQWNNLPFIEMLAACTVVMGVIAAIFLLVNKFPSSHFLGRLILTNVLLLLALMLGSLIPKAVVLTVLVASIVSLYWYVTAFFSQNRQMSLKHVFAIIITSACTLLPAISPYALLVKILVFSIIVGYSFAILRVLNKEGKMRGINWFQNPGSRLIWFRNFIGFNLLITLYWLIAFEFLTVLQLSISLIINFSLVYYQVFKESVFLSPIPLGNKYQKSTLTPDQKYAILEKLNEAIELDKFYLKDDLSLSKVAGDLKTTTHHLSQVINETMGSSFQELIAKHRIREAKRLLKGTAHQNSKIEHIANMVGYNSKSAFNIAFKKYTGTTPTEFRVSKDVASYREERLPERKRPYSGTDPFSLTHVSFLNSRRYMVTNFLKIFYRSLIRNKVFSAIKLFGLAIGFSASVLIYLYITDELSFDKGVSSADQIYRIAWINESAQTRTPHPMALAMQKDWPEVEAATSISPWYGAGLSKQTIRVKNVKTNDLFEEPDFFFADSTFLDVFDLEVIAGDSNALRKPWSVIISDKMAEKYFGEEDPIGGNLTLNDMPVAVAAVIKGMPENSHFHFSGIISYVTLKAINPNDDWMKWEDFGHFNYIKLKPDTDYKELESRIPEWITPYLNWSSSDLEILQAREEYFRLQPITDIHLNSHLRWELENNGNIFYVYILTGTLFFILLIVIINYVNLTTARSFDRAKEIGIRKTLGAFSGNLTMQFYVESILFCLMAFIVALLLCGLSLNTFNYLTDKAFVAADIFNAVFLGKAFLICLVIALISGFYPALTLTSFIPSQVLKSKLSIGLQGNRTRSVLVVAQFFVSAILIISSLIVLKQIDFMKSKNLGFDQEAIISFKIHPSARLGGIDVAMVKGAQEKIKAISGVLNTSAVSNLPGGQFNQHQIAADANPASQIDVSELYTDYNFEKVFNFNLLKGRAFDPTFAYDSAGKNILVNESLVKALNLENPIGAKIDWVNDDRPEKNDNIIVGVIQDFHYRPLNEAIQPMVIQLNKYDVGNIIVKMNGNNFQQILGSIEEVYKEYETELPFEYSFLDQKLEDLYNSEVKTLNVFASFAILALFLACLGLLGMAISTMNQKAKEVGIRKILGASVSQIISLVVNQFSKLIGFALLLGLPTGYLIMSSWLEEFSYRVSLGILPFLVAGVLLFVVAIASISLIVIKIANTNPVDAVKYE